MSLTPPCITGLLTEDRVLYATAVREWSEYIREVLKTANHQNLRLVKVGEIDIVWRYKDGDDSVDFRLLFGVIRTITIKQTSWNICNWREGEHDLEHCDAESTAYFTITDREFYDFGLSPETPMHWQYLQAIWEDKRRCTRCLRRNASMCDCSLYRRLRDAE